MTGSLRQALAEQSLLGAWAALGDPQATEILGNAGFDLVVLDLQHGFVTEASLSGQLDALARTTSHAAVRVAGHLPHQIMRCLDLGADGVVIPLVETASDAAHLVATARYAPAGHRSWGPLWAQLGRHQPEPPEGDSRAAVIVMIETAAGLENVETIAAVDGVDALYVGPNDLALSLGLGRVPWHASEVLQSAILRIIAAGRAAGVPVGVDCQGAETVAYWREHGATFFLTDRDVLLLADAAHRAAGAI